MSAPRSRRRAELLRLLSGRGIEIGALQDPVVAPHLEVSYVDRHREDKLREHYPELAASDFAPIDILDDAETLATIADDSQDFVIANHVIEHMADPIGALLAWQRVLRPGGRLFLAVPDKNETFDRERPLTSIEHLRLDHEDPSPARDFETFREFAREVSAKVFGACALDEADALAQRMWDEQYSIHYHVWDPEAFAAFVAWLPGYLGSRWRLEPVETEPSVVGEFLYVFGKR